MLIGSVMDDLGMALTRVHGLRVLPYWADRITPPAAIIAWPDPLTFDLTMGRGGDRIDLPVIIFAGNLDARSSRDQLSRYLDGTGPASIKAAIETWEPHAYASARVKSASVEVMTVAAVEYLAATFRVDIVGKGE